MIFFYVCVLCFFVLGGKMAYTFFSGEVDGEVAIVHTQLCMALFASLAGSYKQDFCWMRGGGGGSASDPRSKGRDF